MDGNFCSFSSFCPLDRSMPAQWNGHAFVCFHRQFVFVRLYYVSFCDGFFSTFVSILFRKQLRLAKTNTVPNRFAEWEMCVPSLPPSSIGLSSDRPSAEVGQCLSSRKVDYGYHSSRSATGSMKALQHSNSTSKWNSNLCLVQQHPAQTLAQG